MTHTNSPIISDFTLNNKSDNIEYQFLGGSNVPSGATVTQEDYDADVALSDRPAPDYGDMKLLSDEDYHQRKLDDYNATHLNWNIEWAEQNGLCAAKSPEDILIAQISAEEHARKRKRQLALAKQALDKLTEVQRRRYILHFGHGLTTREIADAEGVKHQSVVESISSARKKINKFLSKG